MRGAPAADAEGRNFVFNPCARPRGAQRVSGDSTTTTRPTPPPPPPRRSESESLSLGLSVAYLSTAFAPEVLAKFDGDPNYHDVNRKMLIGPGAPGVMCCPRDGRPGCSFVDYVDAAYTGRTGPATVMLSWCWNYTVGTVVSALSRWCVNKERDPAKTFVWQCALCVNQFRVEEKRWRGEREDFRTLERTFEARIKSTMHLVCLLDPWKSPEYISRIWCIFEVWKAMNTEGCELDIVLPFAQEAEFKDQLGEDGLLAIWKAFEAVRIQKAQATEPSDCANILRLIDPGVKNGDYKASERCAKVNRDVILRLQYWCAETAGAFAHDRIREGRSLGQTGRAGASLLISMAAWGPAETILMRSRTALEGAGAVETLGYSALLRHLADLRKGQGRYEEAADLIGKVIKRLQADIGRDAPGCVWSRRREYAAALRTAAETESLRGRVAAAVRLFEEACRTYQEAGAGESLQCMGVRAKLGSCLCRLGRHEEAGKLFNDATCLDDGHHTPEDGEVLAILGRRRLAQGRPDEAEEAFRRAALVFEETVTEWSLEYAEILVLRGSASLELGAADEAEKHFNRAQGVLTDIKAESHTAFLMLPAYFGRVAVQRGEIDTACKLFPQAYRNMRDAGLMETPDFAQLLEAMAECSVRSGKKGEAKALASRSQAVLAAAAVGVHARAALGSA